MCPSCRGEEIVTVTTSCRDTDGEPLMFSVCASCDYGINEHTEGLCTCPKSDADADLMIGGMCTACGSVEVILHEVTGMRDLSDIGESAEYPTGEGCEVCA